MNIDRLTKKFRDILSEAQHVAHNNRQQFVEALHLVQALINNDCLAKRILVDQSGSLYELQHQVDVEISKLPTVEGENTAMEMSKSILGILQKSEILMKSFSDQYIATDAALVACLENENVNKIFSDSGYCLLYTSPSPRDRQNSRMPSSA